jgi:hypothetical protein
VASVVREAGAVMIDDLPTPEYLARKDADSGWIVVCVIVVSLPLSKSSEQAAPSAKVTAPERRFRVKLFSFTLGITSPTLSTNGITSLPLKASSQKSVLRSSFT